MLVLITSKIISFTVVDFGSFSFVKPLSNQEVQSESESDFMPLITFRFHPLVVSLSEKRVFMRLNNRHLKG